MLDIGHHLHPAPGSSHASIASMKSFSERACRRYAVHLVGSLHRGQPAEQSPTWAGDRRAAAAGSFAPSLQNDRRPGLSNPGRTQPALSCSRRRLCELSVTLVCSHTAMSRQAMLTAPAEPVLVGTSMHVTQWCTHLKAIGASSICAAHTQH